MTCDPTFHIQYMPLDTDPRGGGPGPVVALVWMMALFLFAGTLAALTPGCTHVCATGWSVSAASGRSPTYGADYSGSVELSGGIGRAQCQ